MESCIFVLLRSPLCSENFADGLLDYPALPSPGWPWAVSLSLARSLYFDE